MNGTPVSVSPRNSIRALRQPSGLRGTIRKSHSRTLLEKLELTFGEVSQLDQSFGGQI